MRTEEIMSSKKCFNTFINNLRKDTFLTKEGDVVWRRFVDDVIPLAIFGDGSVAGHNKNILEHIARDASYALEFRARALFVLCIPNHSCSPIYWPHKEPPSSTRDVVSNLGVLRDFAVQMFAYCITHVASIGGSSEDPCRRQDRIHRYMSKYFGYDGLARLIMDANRETARRAIDVLATVSIVASYDNFALHPLTKLFQGSLEGELLRYLDERIRRVVRTCVRQCKSRHVQCETFDDYVSLVKNGIGYEYLRGDALLLIPTQISFILQVWKEYGIAPKHPVHSLTSYSIPRLFSILEGEVFASLRRDIALYSIQTHPEILFITKNFINDPTSIQGVRCMLESLSHEDQHYIDRIVDILKACKQQERSSVRRRRLEDREQKKRSEAYATVAESALAAMRQ